jgi:hypothetical protein
MIFYFNENGRNERARVKVHLSWFRPFSAQTAFGQIIFCPFEYSAQTAKIHYSAQSDSALSNSAQRSTTS